MMLQTGDQAPDFSLLSDENKRVSLAQFAGQNVIIFFYPKAATPGCTTQACGFRDNYETFSAADTTIIGISPDSPEKLAEWKAAEQFPYPLLSDPDHVVAEAYGVWGEKSMYGNKYMGIIRSHFLVDKIGKLADVNIKISPKKSIAQALKTVK